MRRRLSLPALLGILLTGIPLQAEEPGAQVLVECPELSDEERAALEARQLGEVMTRSAGSGTLRLLCDSTQMEAEWIPVDAGRASRRALAREAEDDPTEALHWLAALVLDEAFKDEASSVAPAAPPPETSEESPAAPSGPAPSARASEFEGDVSVEVAATPEPEEGTASPLAAAAPPVRTKKEEAAPVSDRPAQALKPAPDSLAFFLDVALRAQFFGGALVGTLGPAVGAGASLRRWGVRAAVTPQFSLTHVEGVAARDLNIELVGLFQMNQAFSVFAGPVLSTLKATAPGDLISSDTRSTRMGICWGVTYLYGLPRLTLFASGGLRWLGAERLVTLDGEELFRISAFQGMVSLGTRFQ